MRVTLILFILASAAQASPEIQLQIDTLYFGSVSEGGSHRRDFVIGNTGDEDLIVDAVDLLEEFDLSSPSLPFTIAPDSEAVFSVIFRPVGTHPYDGMIWIHSNDPATPELGLPQRARGIPVFEPGEIIWSYQGIENVESSTAIGDLNSDGFPDVVAESFDAGAQGDNLLCISGSGYSTGDLIWSAHPQGGPSNSGGYGDQCLRTTGDLNGNGTEDILLGTAWGCRTVFGIESTTGETIWSYDTYENPPSGWIYSVCPLSDLNDDGVPEALAGAGSDANAGFCLDGATGERLWKMQANDAVFTTVAIDDVDDDQVPDAVFGGGDPSEDRVFCISGASRGTGIQIWTYSTGGSVWSVDRIEDIDDDGYNDVIAGTWYEGNRVLALSGHSSVTPEVIWEAFVGSPVMKVVTCPDLNGDGFQDVIVASWASYVLAISGTDGSELWRNYAGDDVWAAYWSYDLTDDGVVDVLAGSFTGSVILTDGATGETVWERPTNAKIFTVRPIGDVNGDGHADVIAGQQMLSGIGGRIFLISGGTVQQTPVADGQPGRPTAYRTLAGYPNPFNAATRIVYDLQASSPVTLTVYNLLGQKVATLYEGVRPAGRNAVVWNAAQLTSGTYFVSLVTTDRSESLKIVLLK